MKSKIKILNQPWCEHVHDGRTHLVNRSVFLTTIPGCEVKGPDSTVSGLSLGAKLLAWFFLLWRVGVEKNYGLVLFFHKMFSFLTGSERQMKLYHFSREDHAIIKKIVQGIEQIRWFSWKCCSTSLLSYKTKVLFHYLTRSNSALVASATNCLFFKKSGCVDNGCRTITHC